MRKRIVSLLMALVMILSLVPTTVFAEDGTTENLGTVHRGKHHVHGSHSKWKNACVDRHKGGHRRLP